MPVLARGVVDRRLDGVFPHFVARQKANSLELVVRFDEVGSHVAALFVTETDQAGQLLESVRSRRDVGRVVGVQGLGGLVAAEGAPLPVVQARPQSRLEKAGEIGVDPDFVVPAVFFLGAAIDQSAEIADSVVGHVHGAAA